MVVGWRRSDRYVADLMERLYAQYAYDLDEQIGLAAGRWTNPYPAKIGQFGLIHCGHNPYLFGRIVSDLRVEKGPDGTETLTWTPLEIKQEWRDSLEQERAK